MPARKNGPLCGPKLGFAWDELPVGKPRLYRGSSKGAKTNAHRANNLYDGKRFRSFQKNGKVYIERVK